MIVFGAMTPHPPILIPGIGKGEEKKVSQTSLALEQLSIDLKRAEPDTIIFITPHTFLYHDMFNICGVKNLFGNFEEFGFKDFSWEGKNNLELAQELSDQLEAEGIPALLYNNGEKEFKLDHGVLVPLYFLQKSLEYPINVLPIGYTYGTRSEHYILGQIISAVAEKRTERIAIVASGDLSHRLFESEDGREFDKQFIKSMQDGDDYAIMNMDPDLVEAAGECGYKSSLVLLGAFSGQSYEPQVYSYEGPFGVGYGVINFKLDNEK